MSLAPNGRRSNLTAQQYDLVRTIAFKKWFGDWENDSENASKVVDENGEPMVCYHGSNNKFNSFDPKKQKDGFHGLGFYFATNDLQYGNMVYNCFLNLRKPFYVNEDFSLTEIKRILGERYVEIEKLIRQEIKDSYNRKCGGFIFYNFAGNDALKKAGYDGIIQANIRVAFYSNQIKLANGTNTLFDGSNNDIRFKQGGNMENKMTLAQIIEILDKSQITYSRKLSHIYGSEYWDVAGLSYRLADHPKSEWRQSNRIEISLFEHDYKPFYEHLKSRKDIDLSDKSMFEKEYIALAKKTIVVREKDGLLQTTDGFLYENNEQGLTNAAKSMWLRKVYFPIKNKALNNFVEKESAKNRAREDIYGDGGNISKGFNYSIGGL